MELLSMVMIPCVGVYRPNRSLKRVLFPPPDGPTQATVVP
jgi:hypothetical protein